MVVPKPLRLDGQNGQKNCCQWVALDPGREIFRKDGRNDRLEGGRLVPLVLFKDRLELLRLDGMVRMNRESQENAGEVGKALRAARRFDPQEPIYPAARQFRADKFFCVLSLMKLKPWHL